MVRRGLLRGLGRKRFGEGGVFFLCLKDWGCSVNTLTVNSSALDKKKLMPQIGYTRKGPSMQKPTQLLSSQRTKQVRLHKQGHQSTQDSLIKRRPNALPMSRSTRSANGCTLETLNPESYFMYPKPGDASRRLNHPERTSHLPA